MSADEKGFLARWSQRKREAAQGREWDRAEREPEPSDAAAPDPPPAETTASETEPPFDLASLPKLEELTADTDMTVFFKKGVPESIRNAALRKSWALDPAIRNYVNPALDYAYDWNTPGGVPGAGELAPGTDVARMVAQVMGWTEPQGPAGSEAARRGRRAHPMLRATLCVNLTLRTSPSGCLLQRRPSNPPWTCLQPIESVAQDEESSASHDVASQQAPRRHGSARPK